jgi:tetratricopeptide (TPR) repeat protein
MLRWLLLLPGGNREEGLAQMLKTQSRGELLRGEADFQLYWIYLWYEKRFDDAAALIDKLRTQHPRNPLFRLESARIRTAYFHDVAASLEGYQQLLADAGRGAVSFPELAAVQARLGAARSHEALWETDRAIDILEQIVRLHPAAPHGALAEAYLLLGAAHDRLGRRAEAIKAYRAAAASAPSDATAIRRSASRGERQTPDRRAAEAYRLSLEGWRAFEQNGLDRAEAALTRSLQLEPDDLLTRYRFGRLLVARGRPDAALVEFNLVIAGRPQAPATLLSSAYFAAGHALERIGDRARAVAMYESALSAFGGANDTRASARRALARLEPASRPSARSDSR